MPYGLRGVLIAVLSPGQELDSFWEGSAGWIMVAAVSGLIVGWILAWWVLSSKPCQGAISLIVLGGNGEHLVTPRSGSFSVYVNDVVVGALQKGYGELRFVPAMQLSSSVQGQKQLIVFDHVFSVWWYESC